MSPSYDEASVFVLGKYTIELHYFVLLRLVSDSKDSFNFEISLCQSTRFIKTANVNFASKRDSIGFCAKDLFLDQLNDRIVDGHRELHRKLRWHNVCDDQNTTKHNLISTSIRVFEAFN